MDDYSCDFSWRQISEQRIARFESFLGKRAAEVNGVYWRQVRFGFYRPLLQFREYPTSGLTLPSLARLGAAQFAVADGSVANSVLNCLFFENAPTYAIAQLDQNRTRQVKIAAKHFVIRPVTSPLEFKEKGHLAYLSFYARTRYRYGAARTNPAVFGQWTDLIFSIPEILILGAYENGNLVGASLSFLHGDTVCYAAFFCTTESLKSFASDLMLHTVRSGAAKQSGITRVFAGMYKGLEGLDRFYLLRGAIRVRKPAILAINPLIGTFLRHASPQNFSKMLGHFD